MLVEFGVELRLALEDGVQPLDRRDRDSRDWIDHVGRQVLDVVELRELAAIVWRCECLELLQRLTPQVCPVDQEQDSASAGELDQPVGHVCRRKGLPGTRRHLDQRARPVVRQRLLEIADRPRLRRPQTTAP